VIADDAGVGTDAGGAGIDVKTSAQGAGRGGQVAQNHGTHCAGQTNVRVTVGIDGSAAVEANACFHIGKQLSGHCPDLPYP
jgi:hypothetical protein